MYIYIYIYIYELLLFLLRSTYYTVLLVLIIRVSTTRLMGEYSARFNIDNITYEIVCNLYPATNQYNLLRKKDKHKLNTTNFINQHM